MMGMETVLGVVGLTEGGVVLGLALFALRASLLMGTAFLAVLMLHKASAATRHMVWATAFAALLLLPLVCRVGPSWNVLPGGRPAVEAAPEPARAGTDMSASQSASLGEAPVEAEHEPALGTGVSTASSGAASRGARALGSAARNRGRTTGAAAGRGGRAGMALGAAASAPSAGGSTARAPAEPASAGGLQALILWIVGTGLATMLLLLGVLRVKLLAWRAEEIRGADWTALRDGLTAHLRLRRAPKLLTSPDARVPMTWGLLRPCVLLPVQALGWDEGRRRHVLLHEMGHLKRGDLAALLLSQVVCAIHWFNPLVWLAAGRMRMEREHACDDLVLRSGCAASDYAQALLDVVRDLRAPMGPATAVCMAEPSQLGERLRAVLDPHRSRARVGGLRRSLAWGLGALVVVAAGALSPAEIPALEAPAGGVEVSPGQPDLAVIEGLPEQTFIGTCPRPERGDPEANTTVVMDGSRLSGSWVRRSDDDTFEAGWTGRDCWVKVVIEGEVTFTAEEDDVVSVERAGLFQVEHDDDGLRRTLSVQRGSGSALERDYRMDGRARSFDAEAASWLAGLIPSILRETGYQAEERAARLYARGGVQAVLDEVRLMGSDHVEALYLSSLFGHDLSDQEAAQILQVAGQELEGDYELAELLARMAEAGDMTPEMRRYYLDAARTLGGDYEQARVYEELLMRQQLSQQELGALLEEASRSLEGDYEMSEIYSMLLEQPELSDDYVRLLLESAARELQGDYELGQILNAVAARRDLSPEARTAILDATSALEGDYQRAQALQSFMAERHLAEAELAELLAQTRQIQGDYEKAQLLQQIAQEQQISQQMTQQYLDAVGGIEGSYELAGVLASFVEQAELTESQMRLLLQTAGRLGDYEKGELLRQLAAGGKITEALEADFIDVAESISGEYERDRALAALVRARRRR